ncbi:MAG: serine/threonine protein kinase [Deferribacteres bacterium]|nr:serine/threonine protein kinase [Deferribacteres bacterium]
MDDKNLNWQKIQQLFDAALALPAGEREAFLEQRCGDDAGLLQEVQSLLDADSEGHSLLDGGAMQAIDVLEDAHEPGTQVGAYKLVQQIGIGGMGTVFLAERTEGDFEQEVALKLIKRGMDSDEIIRRFQSERQILARLQHPNIARLLDGGLSEQGTPFFTMEYVDGLPITDYCDQNKLDIDSRLRLFQTVCDAVDYAHRNLIVHRDLKPSNILVTDDGTVKLLDFGIAKMLISDDQAGATLTEAGQRVMTLEYASPEQVRGEAVTTATDVYSLGVVLYELLAGQRPYSFTARTPAEIEKIVHGRDPQKPSTAAMQRRPQADTETAATTPEAISLVRNTQPKRLQKRLSGDLDNICMMALQKPLERRYGSAGQLRDDVKAHLDGLPVLARPDSFGYRAGKFVRRHQAAVAAIASVVLLIAVLVGFYTARLAEERDRARLEAAKATEVADFLRGLFEVSDPGRSKGETITARELLNRGAARIDRELAEQPEVQANMMEVIGTVYQSLALLDSANSMLHKSLALREKQGGSADAEIARTLWVLGKVKAQQGAYDQADSLYRKSLQIRRATFGESSEEVAESLTNLGKVHYQKGNFATADSLARSALQIRRALFGNIHPGVAQNLDDLGWLMHERSNYDAADSLHRQALSIRRALFGEDNLEVAESLNNLGNALYAKAEYEAAEPFMRQALAIRQKLLGNDHPTTTYNLTNLAVLLETKRDYSEAEKFYRDVLERHKVRFGEQHPAIADDLTDIGRVLAAQGNFDAAEPLFRQAVQLQKQTRGEGHWLVAYTLNSLATLLHEQNKLPEAEQTFRQGLAIYQAAFSRPNQHVATTQLGLGDVLTARGRLAEAEPLIRAGYQIYSDSMPPEHWQLARAKSILAACLLVQNRADEAKPLLEQSLAVLQKSRGADDKHTRRVQQLLESLQGKR